MKQAIIDIGSNSMRMCVYEIEGERFQILFKEKNMAGLAGYVKDGVLAEEGIVRACSGLTEFRDILHSLAIEQVSVFATASLRNISNTDEAVAAIDNAVGFRVDVISGEEEALYGYTGVTRELDIKKGVFVDIGGASTEVVYFDQRGPVTADSFQIGSLSLYRACVKKILPDEQALKRMQKQIAQELDAKTLRRLDKGQQMACAGGTARAMLKFAKKLFSLPPDCRTVTAKQIDEICTILCKANRAAADLILKIEPDRIHTMIPGALILQHLVRHLRVRELMVSKYGVREGYLCQRVLQSSQESMHTHKTAK